MEGAEDSLSAILGVLSELAAGDLRGLYLAWLSAYGEWERDEDPFGGEDEEAVEPPVPAGLGLTAPPTPASTTPTSGTQDPRFTGTDFDHNLALAEQVKATAAGARQTSAGRAGMAAVPVTAGYHGGRRGV